MSLSRLVPALLMASALAAPAAAPAAERSLYVSLGDSYATGYQATGVRQGRNTRNGFAYQTVTKARARGYRFELVNLGCGGATTTSMLRQTAPCPARALGPGGTNWGGRTQVAAAERLLRRERGRVGLVTISIGGNDVTRCAAAPEPIPCVGAAVEDLTKNLRTITRRIRKAAGPKVRIVGITYPDVILGQYVGENPNQELAKLSVVAFQALINPALKKAYEGVDGKFVDVTKATGAYGSFDETVDVAPYGVIPKPVAEVCRLSYFCEFRDIHLKTVGYAIIADLVARTLPRRSAR